MVRIVKKINEQWEFEKQGERTQDGGGFMRQEDFPGGRTAHRSRLSACL